MADQITSRSTKETWARQRGTMGVVPILLKENGCARARSRVYTGSQRRRVPGAQVLANGAQDCIRAVREGHIISNRSVAISQEQALPGAEECAAKLCQPRHRIIQRTRYRRRREPEKLCLIDTDGEIGIR
eukprot:scaffold22291_cov32-Tisochrysis_lutea.AAC.3